jgi:RNA polymerase sigma factor (sigma-70 family)
VTTDNPGLLERFLATLNARQREVIERRHLNGEPETLSEVGQALGISRERVRQIEVSVLRRLKAYRGE